MHSSAAKPRAPVSPATPDDDRRWGDADMRAAELSWRAKAAEIAHMRRQQAAKDIHDAKKEYSDVRNLSLLHHPDGGCMMMVVKDAVPVRAHAYVLMCCFCRRSSGRTSGRSLLPLRKQPHANT